MVRTRIADELPGRTEDPQWIALLRTNLGRDEKLAKLQRGMVAVCQVAESVQLTTIIIIIIIIIIMMMMMMMIIMMIIIINIFFFTLGSNPRFKNKVKTGSGVNFR